MKRVFGIKRIVLLLLVGGCVVLAGWGSLHTTTALVDARRAALLDADGAINRAVLPWVQQRRIPDRLILAVQTLVHNRSQALNYLTVRNAGNVTLVSRGGMADAFSWLPVNQARQWRGWLYRLRSADDNRPLMRGGQRVGYVHYGIGWSAVLSRAGLPLLLGLLAAIAGLCGVIVSLRRLARSAPAGSVDASIAHAAAAPADQPPRQTRVSRAQKKGMGRQTKDEFAPIATASYGRQREVPDNAPAGAADPPLAADPPSPAVAEPGEDQAQSGAVAPPRESIVARAYMAPQSREVTTSESPMVTETVESAVTPEFHAPRVDVEPQLGDNSLEVCFYPVWRGGGQRILTGAHAALAWRTAEAGLVDATTLIQLAERDGALRAFTQWIARRLSLLHGNWRTLELATVPILLPIPSTMLAFADAEAVWRDALRRTDRDPNDIILRLNQSAAIQSYATLPVRHAFTLDSPDDDVPDACQLLCVDPGHVEGRAEAWRACLDRVSCPILLGPVADPARWQPLITHERVHWFSDAAENLYSPRSFGRLLSRYGIEPL